MNERQSHLLKAIIDEFISTAAPVGSNQIIQSGYFSLSGATIRNEMRVLGEEGFIEQPHTSAGRVPTAKGYKVYVQEHLAPTAHEAQVRQRFSALKELYFKRKDQERVYEAVALLSHMVPNIAFATVPHKSRVYYMGLCNVLRQPEFVENPSLATGVAEILEEHLSSLLDRITVDGKTRFYIGEEDLIPQFQSCALVVREYKVRDSAGAIGILGPMRMDYSYNTVALDLVTDLLKDS